LASPYHADVNVSCVGPNTHTYDRQLPCSEGLSQIYTARLRVCTTARQQICTSLHLEDILADIGRYSLQDSASAQCETFRA